MSTPATEEFALTRTFRPGAPSDLRRTLGGLWRRGGDRTHWIAPRAVPTYAEAWRATRTPEGPGTIRLVQRRGEVTATAWGAGREWLLERAPALLGAEDDPGGFEPNHHPLVAELHRRYGFLPFGRTDAVLEALIPTVLEQKVTGNEANASFARLQRATAEPAPGPIPPSGTPLVVLPGAATLAGLPTHVFHACNVERKRSDVIKRCASYARRLEECVALPCADAHRRLRTLPGVGAWTAAKVAEDALGDADAVAVGDFHLKNVVSWALTGEPRGTDERMIELLEPFRGHRGRVVRLLSAAGIAAPSFGPRLSIQPRW